MGAFGLIFSVIPIVGLIAWPLTLPGSLFGFIGLGRPNPGIAVAGLICSGIGLAICFAWLIFFGMVAAV